MVRGCLSRSNERETPVMTEDSKTPPAAAINLEPTTNQVATLDPILTMSVDDMNKYLDMAIATLKLQVEPLPEVKDNVNQGHGRYVTEGRSATARFLFKEALAHWNKGDHETAHKLLKTSLDQFPDGDVGLNPHEKHILYNLELRYGISLMSLGLLEEGWKYYNRRKEPNSMGFSPARDFGSVKRWYGEDLADKTLVIYPEQGLGDQLMALSFLIGFRDLGKIWCLKDLKELRIEAHWELMPILKRHFENISRIKIVDPRNAGECIEGADYSCSYMDLLEKIIPDEGTLRGYMAANIPTMSSLQANQTIIKEWSFKDPDFHPKRIGLSWKGHGEKWDKGVQIQDLLPLWLLLKLDEYLHYTILHPLTVEDVQWLDEQWQDLAPRSWRDQVYTPIKLPEHKGIFIDPPRLEQYLGMLDGIGLVIGVMSTTLHLSALAGYETWVLAPQGPRTPWYWAMDGQPEKNEGESRIYFDRYVDVYQGGVWPMKGETYDRPWSTAVWWRIAQRIVNRGKHI